jgi:transcription elongation factor S-II
MESELQTYFSKTISNKVINAIKNFSENYAIINEAPYLIDSIYETKLTELNSIFKQNKDIIKIVKSKQYDMSALCYLKPEELDPVKYKGILEKKEKIEYKKNNQATTDVFTCKKCKSTKCIVTEKQTRSGDEPATTFVNCVVCDYNFRF